MAQCTRATLSSRPTTANRSLPGSREVFRERRRVGRHPGRVERAGAEVVSVPEIVAGRLTLNRRHGGAVARSAVLPVHRVTIVKKSRL